VGPPPSAPPDVPDLVSPLSDGDVIDEEAPLTEEPATIKRDP
jgi:hypothetical protein